MEPRIWKAAWLAAVSSTLLVGCAFTRAAKTPMPSEVLAEASPESRTLFVLLPGLYDGPDGFGKGGFPEAALDAGLEARIVGAEAHFGYYRERTVLTRLQEDVLRPAREAGYEDIWLVGVSMGGVGAILYARDHPEDVDGILLLAPYLGKKKQVRRIADSGGIAAWVPEVGREEGFPWEMWLWFQEVAASPESWPEIYLGYGEGDKLAPSSALLAGILPEERVFTTEGGHDWEPWLRLWTDFLETRPVRGSPSPPVPSGR